jgi:hypothetical protein
VQADQFLREHSHPLNAASGPANVHPQVAAINPTQFRKPLRKRGEVAICRRIVFGILHKHANPPHPFELLRPRHHRPRRRAAEPCDELSPFHWMTSSAVASSVSGMVRPSAFAVLRLITSSNLVAC